MNYLYDNFQFEKDNSGIVSKESKIQIDELIKELKVDKNEFFQIVKTLDLDREISLSIDKKVPNRNSFVKLKDTAFITTKGIVSYQNETYKNANRENRKRIMKDWVQILVPIFTLLLAIISVWLINKPTIKKVEQLELRIDSLKYLKSPIPHIRAGHDLSSDTCVVHQDSVLF